MSIPCTVSIRRNSDGEIRAYADEFNDEFIWAEGNYSCDCNRELFFERAEGNESDFDPECGETRYSLRIVALDDGRELYRDDTWHETGAPPPNEPGLMTVNMGDFS